MQSEKAHGDGEGSIGDEESPQAAQNVSVIKSNAAVGTSGKPSSCSFLKKLFFYSIDREDVQAFYLAQFGRNTLLISFMFLSLAILQLANEQAGCPQTDSGGYEECGNKVYGMQPSSSLALMAVVGGIATSLLMPYAGAVVDFSDHRLRFGKVMALGSVLVNIVQIFLFPSTWFVMAILQAVIGTSTYYGVTMVMWSYVSAPTDYDLHGITSSGSVWENIAMFLAFVVVGIVQIATGWNDVDVARFGQAYSSLVGGIAFFFAFRKYKPVEATKPLESGKNLYAEGIRQIWNTTWDLGKTEPAAQRYLFACMFNAAAVDAFTSVSVTYLSMQIQLSSTEIVSFLVLHLAITPFGVLVHRTFARRFGPKKSYVGVMCCLFAVTSLLIGVVAGPDQKNLVWLICVLYGIGLGWYYPSANGYYVSLVPKERVTELWGFNMFASVVLSWAPPLVFASLNELTGNLRYGYLSVLLFMFIGIVIAITIPGKTMHDDNTVPSNSISGSELKSERRTSLESLMNQEEQYGSKSEQSCSIELTS